MQHSDNTLKHWLMPRHTSDTIEGTVQLRLMFTLKKVGSQYTHLYLIQL